MIKMYAYARIINQKTGLCEVGFGTNTSFYQSIGMTQLDVQQSDIDSCWYLADKCPMKTDEEKEREEKERRNQEIDEKIKELQIMALPEVLNGNIENIKLYNNVIDGLNKARL